MDRESLKKLQSERLVAQVKRCYEKVECFRKRMDEKGLKPEDIKGVDDLYKLPFSYKKDLGKKKTLLCSVFHKILKIQLFLRLLFNFICCKA